MEWTVVGGALVDVGCSKQAAMNLAVSSFTESLPRKLRFTPGWQAKDDK